MPDWQQTPKIGVPDGWVFEMSLCTDTLSILVGTLTTFFSQKGLLEVHGMGGAFSKS